MVAFSFKRFPRQASVSDRRVEILRNGLPFGACYCFEKSEIPPVDNKKLLFAVGITIGDLDGPASGRRTAWIGHSWGKPEQGPALPDEWYGTAVPLDHLPVFNMRRVVALAQYAIEWWDSLSDREFMEGLLVTELEMEDDDFTRQDRDLLTVSPDDVQRNRLDQLLAEASYLTGAAIRIEGLMRNVHRISATPYSGSAQTGLGDELQGVLDELAELLEKRVPPETAASPAATTTTKTQRETGSGQPNAAASENAPPADTAQPPTPASTESSARPAELTAQPPSPSQQMSSSRLAVIFAEARPESEPAPVTQETPSRSTEPATEEAPSPSATPPATSDEAQREAAMQEMVDEFTGIAREMDNPHDLFYMAAFMATSKCPDLLLETARKEPRRERLQTVSPHEAAARQEILNRVIKALREMANPEKLLEMARIMRGCESPSCLVQNVVTATARRDDERSRTRQT